MTLLDWLKLPRSQWKPVHASLQGWTNEEKLIGEEVERQIREVEAERDRAIKEGEELKRDFAAQVAGHQMTAGMLSKAELRCAALEAANARYKEALKIYADWNNWKNAGEGDEKLYAVLFDYKLFNGTAVARNTLEKEALSPAPGASEDDCSGVNPDLLGSSEKGDCQHGEAVFWNQFNKVVQCHKCGIIFVPGANR
jgi:hypothetical protein